MLRPANVALVHEVGDHRPRPAGIALVTDLDDTFKRQRFLVELLGQRKLRPVAHRLLAIDILARANGIERLGNVQPVRRGNADHIHFRIREQLSVLRVNRRAGLPRGLLPAEPISVTHGHDVELIAPRDHALDHVDMAAAAAAHPDEAHSQTFVGADYVGARDQHCGRRAQQCRSAGGGSQELAPGDGTSGLEDRWG